MTATMTDAHRAANEAWRGFTGTRWRGRVDVRDFIQTNYTPYDGDSTFLAGPTARTLAVWREVAALFPEERRRGVFDVDTATPSTITSHAPGFIDRDRELIVGLQTDAPLKRAIMPNGGLRMVENSLKAYGYESDPFVTKVFSTYLDVLPGLKSRDSGLGRLTLPGASCFNALCRDFRPGLTGAPRGV
ncbi:Formate acetyltransferase [Streptomyces malaysiensis subsp. malaysiensis]|nr:Formate acetyltransferase [Streptomyces sp. M56]